VERVALGILVGLGTLCLVFAVPLGLTMIVQNIARWHARRTRPPYVVRADAGRIDDDAAELSADVRAISGRLYRAVDRGDGDSTAVSVVRSRNLNVSDPWSDHIIPARETFNSISVAPARVIEPDEPVRTTWQRLKDED
jgi:hypothetical protein